MTTLLTLILSFAALLVWFSISAASYAVKGKWIDERKNNELA